MILGVVDAGRVEIRLDRRVMIAAFVAQVVGDLRGGGHDLGAAGVLAVEGAQRVDLGATHALVAHGVGMLVQKRLDGFPVLRAAMLAAHGVHQQHRRFDRHADGRVEAHEHDDALGVDAGVFGPQAFDANLVEHALATLLRTLGAKHRAGVHELGRSRALRHQIMLHRRAHHAGRALGAQAQAAFRLDGAAIDDALEILAGNGREHLFGDDIGGLADAAHEQIGLLEQRRLDGLVAITREYVESGIAEMRPELRFLGQKVARSFR